MRQKKNRVSGGRLNKQPPTKVFITTVNTWNNTDIDKVYLNQKSAYKRANKFNKEHTDHFMLVEEKNLIKKNI